MQFTRKRSKSPFPLCERFTVSAPSHLKLKERLAKAEISPSALFQHFALAELEKIENKSE